MHKLDVVKPHTRFFLHISPTTPLFLLTPFFFMAPKEGYEKTEIIDDEKLVFQFGI